LRRARPDRRRTLGLELAPLDDDQTGWLVTFSDLVLQLFAFVLVALVLSGGGRPSAAVAPAPPSPSPVVVAAAEPSESDRAVERLAAAGRSLREFVAAEGSADAVQIAVRDSDLIVTMSDTISFPSGSAELLPAAAPILHRIGALALAMPDFDLEVDGHTDDRPIHTGGFPSNLELSLARAARVVHELAAEAPELAERAIAAGYGEHRPLASNAAEAGRARNRRVEIRLLPRISAPSA
jgi:chemotaxis protein MotB